MRRAIFLAAGLALGLSAPALADTSDVYTMHVGKGHLGLVVVGLTDDLKQFFGSGKDGVLVGKVEPGSPAAQAGVKVGDVLATVDGKAIEDASDVLGDLAGKHKGDPVPLMVVRNHAPLMLTARLNDDVPKASFNTIDPSKLGSMFQGFGPAFGADDDMTKQLHEMEQRMHQLEQRMHKLDGA